MRGSGAVASNREKIRDEDYLEKQNQRVQFTAVRSYQEYWTLKLLCYDKVNLPEQDQHIHHNVVPLNG